MLITVSSCALVGSSRLTSYLTPLVVISVVWLPLSTEAGHELRQHVTSFLETHCLDCHQGTEAEAGLDLESLAFTPSHTGSLARWVALHDRVRDGEMPPPDYAQLDTSEKERFLNGLAKSIQRAQSDRQTRLGRVVSRRLTRKQVERSLHVLLGIDIPLAEYMPAPPRNSEFSTVATGQSMSHFQVKSHLAVVDMALDEAFRRALMPADNLYVREFDAQGLSREDPKRRCREPEMWRGRAVIWNGTVIFYGRIPAAKAPHDGWYRFALTVGALNPPEQGGVWSTIRTGLCVSSAPLLNHVASFEATTEPRTIEFETWLPKNHMLEIRPGDATLKRARFSGGQIGAGEGEPQNVPGIAFDGLKMVQFRQGASNEEIRKILFGDLRLQVNDDGSPQIESKTPVEAARQLLRAFASRAFRRPVNDETLQPYVDATVKEWEASQDFSSAMRFGYRAILCSPRFMYLHELPGPLDAHALATRLSYFLTGSPPDPQLRDSASDGNLLQCKQLLAQTERLLDKHGQQFVADFAAEWLDLDKIRNTTPDRKLYRTYDPVVELSLLQETHGFLYHMLANDCSILELIDGDYTFLNSRLAQHYEIPDVSGDQLRHVSLKHHIRGGLLTQGSILKVTANGTNTSPVLRGVWVSERLLGVPIRPPPENVPAIEPDIRGAKSIREQLEKHRSDAVCASCHAKIDPPGFVLENFDPVGQWRDYYRTKKKPKKQRNKTIDAGYRLLDGREFKDIHEFRQLVCSNPRRIAANVAENLVVYGTGGRIEFVDRDVIESIVNEAAQQDYGFRSILKAVVDSSLFRDK